MVEKNLLGKRGTPAQAQKLQDLVLFAGKVHADAVDLNHLGIEVDAEIASIYDRLRMSFGAAHDGMNARHQLVFVEWLCHVVVGTKAETADLVFDADKPGEDENGRLHVGGAQRPQNFESGHVWQIQVEQDNVVIVQLAEIHTLFTEVGSIDVEALELQHQLNGLSNAAVVLN